jgi:hypothetical protein
MSSPCSHAGKRMIISTRLCRRDTTARKQRVLPCQQNHFRSRSNSRCNEGWPADPDVRKVKGTLRLEKPTSNPPDLTASASCIRNNPDDSGETAESELNIVISKPLRIFCFLEISHSDVVRPCRSARLSGGAQDLCCP